eukprot:1276429-Pyramimonas_sp.AAC.1
MGACLRALLQLSWLLIASAPVVVAGKGSETLFRRALKQMDHSAMDMDHPAMDMDMDMDMDMNQRSGPGSVNTTLAGAGGGLMNLLFQDAIRAYILESFTATVEYTAMGSSNGLCRVKNATTECSDNLLPKEIDFACSETPLTEADYEKYPDLQ